ncbi:hypothetical protein DQ384_05130 [Sphaerisporangium album]|uniref:Uncharacterized protein n=1 Tax=Sphaerisporangium album TaxID=509200 RepID=A0A367FR45_9ACTN|nr:hypothetical protein DQ384_05130 [Sphaerisporangium album]
MDAAAAIVQVLHNHGFPNAEHRARTAAQAKGDITGCPGVVWKVRSGGTARSASDAQIEAWLTETITEKLDAGAGAGILVVQRAGADPADAPCWWAIMRAYQLECLISPNGLWTVGHKFPIRMLLTDACTLLRRAGYGSPLPDEVVA